VAWPLFSTLYFSCVDVLGIAIDFRSLTFHCIVLSGVRSVMLYYNDENDADDDDDEQVSK